MYYIRNGVARRREGTPSAKGSGDGRSEKSAASARGPQHYVAALLASGRQQRKDRKTASSYLCEEEVEKMGGSNGDATVITLRGSVEIVSEFFFTAINSIL